MDKSSVIVKSYRRRHRRPPLRIVGNFASDGTRLTCLAEKSRKGLSDPAPKKASAYRLTRSGRVFIDDPRWDYSGDVEAGGDIGLQQFMRMLFGLPYKVGQAANTAEETMEIAVWAKHPAHLRRARRYSHYVRVLERRGYLERV